MGFLKKKILKAPLKILYYFFVKFDCCGLRIRLSKIRICLSGTAPKGAGRNLAPLGPTNLGRIVMLLQCTTLASYENL